MSATAYTCRHLIHSCALGDARNVSASNRRQRPVRADIFRQHTPRSYIRRHRRAEELLKLQESKKLEFKSSLRWNLKEDRKDDKHVTHSALKTIAAFLNTEGGDLLIGVDDDRKVLGIEHDRLDHDDKFMRHLAQAVRNGLGERAGTCIDPVSPGHKRDLGRIWQDLRYGWCSFRHARAIRQLLVLTDESTTRVVRSRMTTATAPPIGIRHYRLSRLEYDRAVEAGAFEPDAKLELIDGHLQAMTPEGSRHAAVMDIVAHHLQRVFGSDFYVRIQHPLAVADYSEPQPDIAVVRGAAHDYLDAHPTTAALIVEISNESLDHDRTVKQRLYARCGITEYWILALPEARLEVYREPAEDGYRTVTTHASGDEVGPLARPDAQIAVDELLP